MTPSAVDMYPEPPPITLAAKAERAHIGSPEATGWCPKCRERAVPMRDGTCGFCGEEQPPPPPDMSLPPECGPRCDWRGGPIHGPGCPHYRGPARPFEPAPDNVHRTGLDPAGNPK